METDEQKKELFVGKLLREPFGIFYYNEQLEKQALEVTKDKLAEPLYGKYDRIVLNKSQISFLEEDQVETTVGRLLLNLIVIFEPFQGRIKYINKAFTPGYIEERIAPLLQDATEDNSKREPGKYYVDEYLKFCKAVSFIEQLAKIFAQSVTRAGMLPPPGREKVRKELLEKYKGKLNDPVEMVKFQDELRAFDNAYLKENDPSYGKFMSGSKILGAHLKTYLTQGGESNEFTGQLSITPITQPLEQGIDLTPEKFTAVANTIRYGSYSRGAETVNGGVVAKALMTALDTWRITPGDCKATLGTQYQYGAKKVKELVDRYVIENGKPILIETEEQAKAYIDKVVFVRSPQYCRRPGTETCEVCAGRILAKYPNGQVVPAMEVSSGIMSDSLKKMHNTTASTKTMELKNTIS